jgi:hypothetical protein
MQGIEPWVRLIGGLGLLIVLPISLLLLIFRKTRGWGGIGIYLVSWPLGLWIWVASLLYALSVSVFWTVAGLLFAGVGVVPVALVMTILRRDWGNLWALLGNIVATFVLRSIGLWITGRVAMREEMEKALAAQPPVDSNWGTTSCN